MRRITGLVLPLALAVGLTLVPESVWARGGPRTRFGFAFGRGGHFEGHFGFRPYHFGGPRFGRHPHVRPYFFGRRPHMHRRHPGFVRPGGFWLWYGYGWGWVPVRPRW